MRKRDIVGISRRRPRSLTRQNTAAAPAPDLIRRDCTASAPGLRFVGDITYLPTAEGWLYLATMIDLFNREVAGHAMAGHMRTELISGAVELAHRRGLVRPGAILHSDRGSQGEFNWSSQHLDHGGVRWVATRSWGGCRSRSSACCGPMGCRRMSTLPEY